MRKLLGTFLPSKPITRAVTWNCLSIIYSDGGNELRFKFYHQLFPDGGMDIFVSRI
jgi:hypothetical protein